MSFQAIVGHRRLLSLIARAVAHDTLPPSLLFAGPRGVGKRATADALALAINCQQQAGTGTPGDACGECVSCRRIERGLHPDVIVVEPGDSGSIKVDQVRAVIDQAGYRPFEGRRRVVIIDDADAMVHAAQSALLKTLEEPPSSSIFVLVSSRPDALLATVRSRCPRLRFGALSAAEVASVLVQQHGYGEVDAHAAAADADGSIGRALTARSGDLMTARTSAQRLLEVAVWSPDPTRRIQLAQALAGKKKSAAEERAHLRSCLLVLSSLLRDLSVLTVHGDSTLVVNADLQPELERLAGSTDMERALSAYRVVDSALVALERNASSKVVADWLVLRL